MKTDHSSYFHDYIQRRQTNRKIERKRKRKEILSDAVHTGVEVRKMYLEISGLVE